MRVTLVLGLAVTLVVTGLATAAAGQQATSLTIQIEDDARHGEPHAAVIVLTDARGRPLAGETIILYEELALFDYTDTVVIGEVQTDYRGVAALSHIPLAPGRGRLIAEYAGNEAFRPVTAAVPFEVAAGAGIPTPVIPTPREPLLPRGVTAAWFLPLLVGVWLALGAAVICAAVSLPAQQTVTETRDPKQTQDEEFSKSVREWTTQPYYISPLVDHLPRVAGIPTPKDILGYHIGAPGKLTYYADILKYYRALAASSPRVKVESIGNSDEDRELVVVWVSSDENLRNLQKNRDSLARIADPRGLSEEQARQLIAATKPHYHFMGGLHSGETGPPDPASFTSVLPARLPQAPRASLPRGLGMLAVRRGREPGSRSTSTVKGPGRYSSRSHSHICLRSKS